MRKANFYLAVSLAFVARGETVSVTRVVNIKVSATGIYESKRDIFRRGGHGWISPAPGYSQSEGRADFFIRQIVPQGATVTGARVSWSFARIDAYTKQFRPDLTNFAPSGAKPPRVYGSSKYCVYEPSCQHAAIDRFDPEKSGWANYMQLQGAVYAFPRAAQSGTVDLRSVYRNAVIDGMVSFYMRVQYTPGRPYFRTEGRNHVTQFDVSGGADAQALVTLTVDFSAPKAAPKAVTSSHTESQEPVVSGDGSSAISEDFEDGVQGDVTGPPLPVQGLPEHGKALSFGSGSFVRFDTVDAARDLADEGTVALWARPTELPQSLLKANWRVLLADPGFGDVLDVRIEADGSLSATARGAACSASISSSPDRIVDTKKWNHIALTWKLGSAVFYLNGRPVGVAASCFAPNAPSFFYLNGYGTNETSVAIDDLLVSRKALQPEAIAALAGLK